MQAMPARLAVAACLVLCACATPAPRATLYQRLGGMPAVEALVNDGLRHISADSRINARFAHTSPAHLNASLVDLVCERTGGPCLYKGRDMSAAHEGMEIRDDEFDALVDDLARAMDDRKIGGSERAELLGLLARMRNAIVGH